jgi:hypothetical protein
VELPYKVKPPSIVVKAGGQPSIVIDLAVLATVDTKAVEKLNEFLRKRSLTSHNKVATAIARAAVRTAMGSPNVRIQGRLAITSEIPVTK